MVLDQLRGKVISAAMEVHSILGPGYLESVYEQALAVELEKRKSSYLRQRTFQVAYKGTSVGEGRLDLLVENCLVVELKTVEALQPIHVSQVISYLKALDLH